MSKQTINIGASPNDGTGTPLRTSFDYTNQNFTEIYTALGGGVALPGATTQVIFNDGGTNLAGDAGLVYNKTTDALTVAGLVTAGSATITGALTVDTTTLVVDATNDRVGFKTASPADIVEVVGSGSTGIRVSRAGALTQYATLSAGATGPTLDASSTIGELSFGLNASTAMTLNSMGLGIGAVPSGWVGAGGPVILFGGSNGNLASNTQFLNITSNAYFNAGYKYIGTGLATNYVQNQGAHEWHVAPSGTAGNAITFNQAMTLNASGRLGIGTVTPAVNLTVRTTHAVATATTYTGGFLIHDEPNGIGAHFNAGVAYDGGNQHSWIQSNSSTGVLPLALNPAGGDVRIGDNLVMLTPNKGIDFSINSNAGGATSEILNDYEEGTWTGTIGGTTANPFTPVIQTGGRYTKIGRQVSVEIGFYGDTTGASGRITVSGLPFTSNASLSRPGVIIMADIGTFTGSPVAFLGAGVTSVDLYASNSNASSSNVTHNAGAGRSLYMALTYTV